MRILLVLILVAFVGGVGYYIGRHSVAPAEDTEISRSRVEPAPSAAPPAESVTPPTSTVGTPPAVETGPGAAAPAVPDPNAAAAVPPSTGPVNEGVAPQATPADPGPLVSRNLGLPVANITAADIRDTFNQSRGNGERRHEAADIMAPKGTPVLAVDNGIIQKLFNSKPGGLTIYQFDPTEKYAYYYAHLDRYADGIREGQLVKKGDLIGYVGVTGNSDPNAPHLHFGIFELGPEKKWYGDLRPVNPYPLLMRSAQSQTSRATKR
jgi:peptidoglycan LD-endopeptidase LytH